MDDDLLFLKVAFNTFQANISLLYPLKIPKKQRFSDAFMGIEIEDQPEMRLSEICQICFFEYFFKSCAPVMRLSI